MAEYVDIMDEDGNKTGEVKTKLEAHQEGLWHQASHVWIYNSQGEVLIQKRARKNDSYPGYWDLSAAGHITAGENPLIAAVREMEEEIGIKAKPSDLKKVGVAKDIQNVPVTGWDNKEFIHLYIYKYEGNIKNLELQEEEVEEIKFVTIEKLRKIMKKKNFVHNNYYDKIVEELEKVSNQTS